MNYNLDLLHRWIIDSLKTIQKNNCDALLLGCFSGSVIELLGRFINPSKQKLGAYGLFLERYMPDYYHERETLYKLLRCHGAHAVLAMNGVFLTCDSQFKAFHMKCIRNPELRGRKDLAIHSPTFMVDLIVGVDLFFGSLKSDAHLRDQCSQVLNELYTEGQLYMKDRQFVSDIPWKGE